MDLDAQLLERYARTRDADAFTQLVRRHAGMVFGVARRITLNHHDAEEVAQACFLELARQAAAIHGSLAGWLHAAATHRAVNVIRAAGRRRRHELAAAKPEVTRDATWDEIAPLVDAALADLPEELRGPMVLYHLEGRTQAEVAEELGVSQATVSRRIESGVETLRESLRKGGVLVPAVVLGTLLLGNAAEAAPPALVVTLGKLAISGAVPAKAALSTAPHASLAVKPATMVLVAASLVLAGAGLCAVVLTPKRVCEKLGCHAHVGVSMS